MSRVRLSRLLLAVVMLFLAGCQVEVAVDLDVAENGSGTVRAEALFDADATNALGDIADQLRIDDLGAAGWDITIDEANAGSTQVVATKPVTDPDQWQQVLDEIIGPGVFNDVSVETEQAFATSRRRIGFELDLSQGWDLVAGDEVVTDGPQQFARLIGDRELDDIVTTTLTATLAGNADGPLVQEQAQPRFDDDEPLRINLVATSEDSTAILLRWIAIALFSLFVLATVLALIGIVLQRRADRDRPAPTPASLISRVPGAAAQPAPTKAPSPTSTDDVRLVVIEPLTVLYQPPLFMTTFVLSFVRDRGGTARADEILDAHSAAVVGTISTADFWRASGSNGDVSDLDQAYLDHRSMRKGASEFLVEMERRRIPVAAVTTDAARWSSQLRDRDRLSGVWPWLASGNVGVTGRDAGMFEVLHRESGVAYQHCLYIDTDVERLNLARELGMRTAWLDDGTTSGTSSTHPVVHELKDMI